MAVIINQPKTILAKSFSLFLKADDIVIVDNYMHALSFTDPGFVLEVQASSWKCGLRQKIHINL